MSKDFFTVTKPNQKVTHNIFMNFLPTINEQDQSVCHQSMEETNENIVR